MRRYGSETVARLDKHIKHFDNQILDLRCAMICAVVLHGEVRRRLLGRSLHVILSGAPPYLMPNSLDTMSVVNALAMHFPAP
jgi:hypothetical protein